MFLRGEAVVMDALYLRGQPLFLWLVGLLALSGGLVHRPLLHGEALQPHALCETLHQQRRRKKGKNTSVCFIFRFFEAYL